MDVRREANRVGLTIRGTQKIWNSSLAGIGLLHARRQGAHRAYNDEVFERFWKRELDIENPAALDGCAEARRRGCLRASTRSWRAKAGASCKAVQEAAEAGGVFGVPSFLFPDGDLYWGREHLPRIREILAA